MEPSGTRPVLQVIICSTRPGRVGEAIAKRVYAEIENNEFFDVELVDLADFNLPVFNEPMQPFTRQYEHEHTKKWAASVERAGAFIFVMPEYNHSFSGGLKNAIDYLYHEWRYKPVGLVSYGGTSMEIRATLQLKPILAQLKLIHAADVHVSLLATPVVDGVFEPAEMFAGSVQHMVNELARTYTAIHPLQG